MTDIDPGESLGTPGGTGPLGTPEGDGLTYGDPGTSADPGNSTTADGTEGGSDAMSTGGTSGTEDGTGERSDGHADPQAARLRTYASIGSVSSNAVVRTLPWSSLA